MPGQLADHVADLNGQLARRHQHQRLDAARGPDRSSCEQGQPEGERLARAGPRLAHDVAAIEQQRDDVGLDGRGRDDAARAERLDQARLNVELGERSARGICPSGRTGYLPEW